jgi:rhodanese-related sulfurtransferase
MDFSARLHGSASRTNAFLANVHPLCPPKCRSTTRRQPKLSVSASTSTANAPGVQIAQYPDPAFCKAVMAAFPAAGTCSPDEARVLYSENYAFLDVRSAEELETEGKVLPKMPNVFHVPIVKFSKRYDSGLGRKVVDKTPNSNFVADVAKLATSKDQELIILCSGVPSQGQQRSQQALEQLKTAGYTNLVVLQGGYPAWAVLFTNKLERRVVGFVIASGGTSIEQSTGVSSKGSGVGGKDVNSLLRDQLMNYAENGLYADV